MTTEALPPTLAANPRLGNWLRISSDGAVEIRSGKVELGQGVLTALAQVAAEELDVDVARIKMTAATTDLSPDEGLTAGSLSIQHSGAALRQVCAEVRDIYVGIAAEKLAVPKEELTIDDGQIFAQDGAATSYWELADDTLMDRASQRRCGAETRVGLPLVGTSVARLDLPDKLSGRPRYVHDLTLDGMLYGRVVRPPSRAATLLDIDTGPTETCPAWSRWCATATSSPWWPNTRRLRCEPPTFCVATPFGSSDRHCQTRTTCPPFSPRRRRTPP